MKRWYLAIVHLAIGDEGITTRLTRDVPPIERALKGMSDDQCKLLLRSDTGQMAAWMLRTAADSKQIVSRIHNPGGILRDGYGERHAADSSRRGDKIAVFQLSEDRSFSGLNVFPDWITRQSKLE
jgi:hypothetical protein